MVRLGEHDITQAEETDATVELRIARVLAHPAWNPATLDNDLALVKLVRVGNLLAACSPLERFLLLLSIQKCSHSLNSVLIVSYHLTIMHLTYFISGRECELQPQHSAGVSPRPVPEHHGAGRTAGGHGAAESHDAEKTGI